MGTDALARDLHELEALYESLRALTSTLDLGQILHMVLSRIRALLSPDALSLLLYDRQNDELGFAPPEPPPPPPPRPAERRAGVCRHRDAAGRRRARAGRDRRPPPAARPGCRGLGGQPTPGGGSA